MPSAAAKRAGAMGPRYPSSEYTANSSAVMGPPSNAARMSLWDRTVAAKSSRRTLSVVVVGRRLRWFTS